MYFVCRFPQFSATQYFIVYSVHVLWTRNFFHFILFFVSIWYTVIKKTGFDFPGKEVSKFMDKIRQLQDMINESNRIVFFGGAGVSTESNIPDFRSADGLYKQKYRYSPEQIVSHSVFHAAYGRIL